MHYSAQKAWTPVFRQIVFKQRNRSLKRLRSLHPHLSGDTTRLDTALSNLLLPDPTLSRGLDWKVFRVFPQRQLFCHSMNCVLLADCLIALQSPLIL